VLPPELDFEVLSINPSDLALLDTQEFNAKALATAYGVPSVLLNMALQGGLTYQNPGALGEMWWRFELRNTATRIANALSERLLPRGQFVTIDAADTFAELSDLSEENDPTKSADELEPAPPVRLIGGATV
jgi:phage portal protein BeeE